MNNKPIPMLNFKIEQLINIERNETPSAGAAGAD